MTRASLLHVLDPDTALGPQQVRELEALAQAFPYCQTAHLLLAKAAHDQGAMLAGQRLRRAATYAADRALLRRLIETPPLVLTDAVVTEAMPAAVVVSALAILEPAAAKPVRFVVQQRLVGSVVPTPVVDITSESLIEGVLAVGTDFLVDEPDETPVELPVPAPTPSGAGAPAAPAQSAASTPAISRAGVATVAGWSVSTTAAPDLGEAAVPSPPKAPTLAVEPPLPGEVGTVEAASFAAGSAAEKELDAAEPATVSAAAFTSAPNVAAADEPAFASASATSVETEAVVFTEPDATPEYPTASIAAKTAPVLTETEATAALVSGSASQVLAVFEPLIEISEPLALALAAPPVRPPSDAGAARFEYGLADALDPTPAYLLPGLTDEWTWTLPPKPFVPPGLTPAAFLGDETLGYGWGESSRLGLALMPLGTEEQPDDALSVAFVLPLPNTFFAPDALLLAHWAEHRPRALPPPTSLELIETFLRQKPRLTRPALAKTTAETPTDLAAPSTNAPPELISESLARILARQGKLVRAIEVYERLMVKHPEKMAYFATEIQSLQLQQPPLP